MKTFLGILSLEAIEKFKEPKDVHEDLTLVAYFQGGDMPIGVTIDLKSQEFSSGKVTICLKYGRMVK
jgi:hypothetical protein